MASDATQIDHQLFKVAEPPVLLALANKRTLATHLDGRACRYLYATAQETMDPSLLSAHEMALVKMLGIDLTYR